MTMSFGGAMQARLGLAKNKQRMMQQKINDDYELGLMSARSGAASAAAQAGLQNQTAELLQDQRTAALNDRYGHAAMNAANVQNQGAISSHYNKQAGITPAPVPTPTGGMSQLSNMTGNSFNDGYSSMTGSSFDDLEKRTYNQGTSRVKPKEDPQKRVNQAASAMGGMAGMAVRSIRGRQQQLEDQLNAQMGERKNYRKGTKRVTGPGNDPTKDTIPAMLAPEEAVLNAGAANLLGRDKIADLNKRGLKRLGKKDGTKWKDGVVHAYGGIDFNDPEMKRRASLAEMQRRMQGPANQPVARVAPVAPAAQPAGPLPTYDVKYMPPESAERAGLGKARPAGPKPGSGALERISTARQAEYAAKSAPKTLLGRGAGLARMALSTPVAGVAALLQSGEAGSAADDEMFARYRAGLRDKGASQPAQQTMTVGDALRTQRQTQGAEPQYTTQVATPPADQDESAYSKFFSAQGITDDMRRTGRGLKDLSDAGNKIYKTVDAQGRTTYTGMGSPARLAAEKAAAAVPKTKEEAEVATANFSLAQQKMLADIQQRALAGDPQAIQQMARLNPPKPRDAITVPSEEPIMATNAKGESAPTGQVRKRTLLYNQDTGEFIDPEAVTASNTQEHRDAQRAINAGRITKAEANKRLVAAGLKPIP